MNYGSFRFEMLKKEIDMLSQKINHFDNLRLRTKQMALALWIAIVGFGIKNTSTPDLNLLIFAAFIPIPFWIMDTRYKTYYKGFFLRLKAIRRFITDGKYNVAGDENSRAELGQFLSDQQHTLFPIFDYWASETVAKAKHQRNISFFRNFFSGNNLLIYLPMSLLGIGLAIYVYFING